MHHAGRMGDLYVLIDRHAIRGLYNNQLTSLDSGLFSSLTSLQQLYVKSVAHNF